jgi:preprotein translocase subunit YajC
VTGRGQDGQDGPDGPYDDLPGTTRRPLILRAVVRPVLSVTGLLLLYYLLPFQGRRSGPTPLTLLVGLVLFAVLLTWQVIQIRTATYPRLRALEALSFSLPLFLLVFAMIYFVVARADPASFSEQLSRTDALYFAVTVFTSVGFGDITPVMQGARIVVMIQMIGGLILVGVVARVILGAVQAALSRPAKPGDHAGG